MAKQPIQNLAPELERSWLEVELIPRNKDKVTSDNVEKFQKKLAELCGMHIFCGPMVIAPDSDNNLSPYYTNQKFKPKDWNAFTWWTRPDATNVMSILDHSHESFYYYPDHNLIDISVATCKEYNLKAVLKFVQKFWEPDTNDVRYAFLTPKEQTCSWEIFPS